MKTNIDIKHVIHQLYHEYSTAWRQHANDRTLSLHCNKNSWILISVFWGIFFIYACLARVELKISFIDLKLIVLLGISPPVWKYFLLSVFRKRQIFRNAMLSLWTHPANFIGNFAFDSLGLNRVFHSGQPRADVRSDRGIRNQTFLSPSPVEISCNPTQNYQAADNIHILTPNKTPTLCFGLIILDLLNVKSLFQMFI